MELPQARRIDSLYIYIYIYIYICISVCIYIYMCIYIHICVYVCIYIYIYLYTHVHLSLSLSLYLSLSICIYIYIYIYTYMYTHMCPRCIMHPQCVASRSFLQFELPPAGRAPRNLDERACDSCLFRLMLCRIRYSVLNVHSVFMCLRC